MRAYRWLDDQKRREVELNTGGAVTRIRRTPEEADERALRQIHRALHETRDLPEAERLPELGVVSKTLVKLWRDIEEAQGD